MKQWGSVVVVADGDWQAYDCDWVSGRVCDMLIGGLDLALRHIGTFRSSDDGEWYPPLARGGGTVIDVDRKRLLFFGDELMDEMPLRRVLLPVLQEIWSGFDVTWAYGGSRELAAYVGVELMPSEPENELWLVPSGDWYSSRQLVSAVGRDSTVRLWSLDHCAGLTRHGPLLLDALPGRGRQKLALKNIPVGGVHVDVDRGAVGVWTSGVMSASVDALEAAWSGWNVEFWEDRYEEQASRCGDVLRMPPLKLATAVGRAREFLRGRIMACGWESPAAEALALADALRRISPGCALTANEVIAGLVRPNEDEWRNFAAACATVRSASAAAA